MTKVKIKSQAEKSPIITSGTREKPKSPSEVMRGFRFGFGIYLSFLFGTLVVIGFALFFWWVLDQFGVSLL